MTTSLRETLIKELQIGCGRPRPVRAPRGKRLHCKGWQQEAALRMLCNNLDPECGEIELPWVRLHGCKGYTDMVWHLQAHPSIKATFNFSGTLLSELALMPSDTRKDRYRQLSRREPGELTYEEKVFILKHFFSLHSSRRFLQ